MPLALAAPPDVYGIIEGREAWRSRRLRLRSSGNAPRTGTLVGFVAIYATNPTSVARRDHKARGRRPRRDHRRSLPSMML
jgi:hypothetical protein